MLIERCLPIVERGLPLCLRVVAAIGSVGTPNQRVVTDVQGCSATLHGVVRQIGGVFQALQIGLALITEPA
ncbi:hypothetical protein GCM10023107_66160 [Actinoplanes octamycinicus]|nr:hypothetical protein Aoc01nite_82470 [Actinoplanes octamycinicus]